jgi:hypothetical protein
MGGIFALRAAKKMRLQQQVRKVEKQELAKRAKAAGGDVGEGPDAVVADDFSSIDKKLLPVPHRKQKTTKTKKATVRGGDRNKGENGAYPRMCTGTVSNADAPLVPWKCPLCGKGNDAGVASCVVCGRALHKLTGGRTVPLGDAWRNAQALRTGTKAEPPPPRQITGSLAFL